MSNFLIYNSQYFWFWNINITSEPINLSINSDFYSLKQVNKIHFFSLRFNDFLTNNFQCRGLSSVCDCVCVLSCYAQIDNDSFQCMPNTAVCMYVCVRYTFLHLFINILELSHGMWAIDWFGAIAHPYTLIEQSKVHIHRAKWRHCNPVHNSLDSFPLFGLFCIQIAFCFSCVVRSALAFIQK